jgi:hypothetical protein
MAADREKRGGVEVEVCIERFNHILGYLRLLLCSCDGLSSRVVVTLLVSIIAAVVVALHIVLAVFDTRF